MELTINGNAQDFLTTLLGATLIIVPWMAGFIVCAIGFIMAIRYFINFLRSC